MGTCYSLQVKRSDEERDYKDRMHQYKRELHQLKRRRTDSIKSSDFHSVTQSVNNSEIATPRSDSEGRDSKRNISKIIGKKQLKSAKKSFFKLDQQLVRLKNKLCPKILQLEEKIVSNYVLQILSSQDNQSETRNDITEGSQKIIHLKKEMMIDQYFTPGINIEEILCDFLNSHSTKFMKFCILDSGIQALSPDQEYKRIDYRVVAYDYQNQKRHLEAKFFIADIHAKDKAKIIKIMNRAQTYKVLQRCLPVKIQEEIIEVQDQNVNNLVRYCVLFEFETRSQNAQLTFVETQHLWLKNSKDILEEQFSLEKLSFYLVQLLQHLIFLEKFSIYTYLDVSDTSLTINEQQQVLLKSDLSLSFLLHHIRVKDSDELKQIVKNRKNLLIKESLTQLQLSKQESQVFDLYAKRHRNLNDPKSKMEEFLSEDLYLRLDLFKENSNQYEIAGLVDSKKMADYNTRLQVALIFTKMLEGFEDQSETPVLKSMILSQGFEKQMTMLEYQALQSSSRNKVGSSQDVQDDAPLDDSQEFYAARDYSNMIEEEHNQLQHQLKYQQNLKQLFQHFLIQLKDQSMKIPDLKTLLSNFLLELNNMKVFLNLIQQYYQEKKYKACVFLHQQIQEVLNLSQQIFTIKSESSKLDYQIYNLDNFQNRFYIMLYSLRSQIKLGNLVESGNMLGEIEEYFKVNVVDAQMLFKHQKEEILLKFEQAKVYYLSKDLSKTLDEVQKVQYLNSKRFSENNKLTVRCLTLQYKCHLILKDFEKALKFLEAKLAIQSMIQGMGAYSKQVAKTYFQIGLIYKKLDVLEQAIFYVEKSHTSYARILGDISSKSLEVLKELAALQMLHSDYSAALKNCLFLFNQHSFAYNENHIFIYLDNRNITECALKCRNFDLALFHSQLSQDIADKIFVVIDKDQNERLKLSDKDSVFESLDLEYEQYSFLNFLQAQVQSESMKNYLKAQEHFQKAEKYINLLRDKSSQKDYMAQVRHLSALNCIKLKRYEEAQKSLERALSYYQSLDPIIDADAYETTRKLYQSLIQVKKDQGNLAQAENSAKNFVTYIKLAVASANKLRIDTKDREYDLVKAYDTVLQFFRLKDIKGQRFLRKSVQINLKEEGDSLSRLNDSSVSSLNAKKGRKFDLNMGTQIEEVLLDQLRIYERKIKEMMQSFKVDKVEFYQRIREEYLRLLTQLGDFYFELDNFTNAIHYFELAKKEVEKKIQEKKDKKEKQGMYKIMFDVVNSLARSYIRAERFEDSMREFNKIFDEKSSPESKFFSDVLTMMPAYEAYEYHKDAADLFEKMQKFKEAGMRYHRCLLMIKELYEDDESKRNEETLSLLSSLAYCKNMCGEYESAFSYQQQILELNVAQFGKNHPNTLNTYLSSMRVLSKIRYNPTFDPQALRKAFKAEVISILGELAERYAMLPVIKFSSQGQANPHDISSLSIITQQNNISQGQDDSLIRQDQVEDYNKKIFSLMTAQELEKYESELRDYLLLKGYLNQEANVYLLISEFRPNKDLSFEFLRSFKDLDLEMYQQQIVSVNKRLQKIAKERRKEHIKQMLAQKERDQERIVKSIGEGEQNKPIQVSDDQSKEQKAVDMNVAQNERVEVKTEDTEEQKQEKENQVDKQEERHKLALELIRSLQFTDEMSSIQRLLKIFDILRGRKEAKNQIAEQRRKSEVLTQSGGFIRKKLRIYK